MNSVKDEFRLTCGKKLFVVRGESDSQVCELLKADGSIQSRLTRWAQFDGPMHANLPHGTWTLRLEDSPTSYATMEFRDGELVDYRAHGERCLNGLNHLRALRDLPALTDRDFPDEATKKQQKPWHAFWE
jgi:hypothetical protein